MPKIDAKLTTAYEQFVASTSRTPGIVDEQEAMRLMEIAEGMNESDRGCCGLFGGDKGDKHIGRLVDAHPDQFNPGSKSMIKTWQKTHKMPTSVPTGTPSAGTPSTGTPSAGTPSTGTPSTGTPSTGSTGSVTGPTAPDTASPYGKVVGNWECEKKTWHCHWFPMRATAVGGDPTNNLYAEGGALAKYDQAFGGKARAHELAHNAKAHDSDAARYGWWGHCNNASEVACLLRAPVREVTMGGVTFSPHDIQGLLVKVSDSLADRVDFRGNRYNGPSDDPNDPTPADFMKSVLQGWGSADVKPIPFILDIDRTEQVWNYPFDQGKIYESDKAPAGFDASSIPAGPSGSKVKFYRAEVKGSGFPEQARAYQFWIQTDSSGVEKKSGWIAGEDTKISPDFAWRPHPRGDLSRATAWVTDTAKQNNPFVLAENVFKIYSASI